MEHQSETYQMLWKLPHSAFLNPDIFERRPMLVTTKILINDGSLNAIKAGTNKEASKIMSNNISYVEPERTEVKKNEDVKQAAPQDNNNGYNFEVNGEKIKLATTSCLLFPDKSIIRRVFVEIILWKYTEPIILCIILLNAIIQGYYRLHKNPYETSRNYIVHLLLFL